MRLVVAELTERLILWRPLSLVTLSLSILTDLEIGQVPLSSNLFPGVPGGVLVHQGFRDAHSATAPAILAQVKNLIATKGSTSVVVVSLDLLHFGDVMKMLIDCVHLQVGHSLGGAIAELDTIYLRLNLPSSVSVKGITFGTPRVGNPAWASWFNSKASTRYLPKDQSD